MAERGLSLSSHRAKSLAEVGTRWDYVITVCDAAYEQCPEFEAKTSRLHWSVEDPSRVPGTPTQQLEVFRRVRDDLAERVGRWLADLTER
jgi:arsenate reductase